MTSSAPMARTTWCADILQNAIPLVAGVQSTISTFNYGILTEDAGVNHYLNIFSIGIEVVANSFVIVYEYTKISYVDV